MDKQTATREFLELIVPDGMCCELLLIHGKPPARVAWHPEPDVESEAVRRKMYHRRNKWVMAMYATLTARYGFTSGELTKVLLVYENWAKQLSVSSVTLMVSDTEEENDGTERHYARKG